VGGAVSEKLIGEQMLAAAVIKRAVDDVRHGGAKVRREAISDIADGGLDYWVEVLSVGTDVYDSAREELGRLIGEAAKCA
jgi:hypothetical protein